MTIAFVAGMSRSPAGYALVETLVAAGVMVGLAAGVAQVALLTGSFSGHFPGTHRF